MLQTVSYILAHTTETRKRQIFYLIIIRKGRIVFRSTTTLKHIYIKVVLLSFMTIDSYAGQQLRYKKDLFKNSNVQLLLLK